MATQSSPVVATQAATALQYNDLRTDAIRTITGYRASERLRNSNNTSKNTINIVATKLKEVKINADLAACRVKFGLYNGATTNNANAQIYKNGVAIGTLRSTASLTEVTYSQDFTGFVTNDLIQIYAYVSVDGSAIVLNMRFYYGKYINYFGIDELVDKESLAQEVVTADISMTNQDP